MEILKEVHHGDLGSLPWRFKRCCLPFWGSPSESLGVMFDAVHCWASVNESYLGEKRKGLERSPKIVHKTGVLK